MARITAHTGMNGHRCDMNPESAATREHSVTEDRRRAPSFSKYQK